MPPRTMPPRASKASWRSPSIDATPNVADARESSKEVALAPTRFLPGPYRRDPGGRAQDDRDGVLRDRSSAWTATSAARRRALMAPMTIGLCVRGRSGSAFGPRSGRITPPTVP